MTRTRKDALALRMRRGEWELVALALLLALAETARAWPPGTVDDVMALLSAREEGRGRDA